MSRPVNLVQGTLNLLILKMLAIQPMNGWTVSQRLEDLSSDALRVSDGSLYPALHALEQKGLIKAEWMAGATKRQTKVYSLTRAGRRRLELEVSDWDRLSAAISAIARIETA